MKRLLLLLALCGCGGSSTTPPTAPVLEHTLIAWKLAQPVCATVLLNCAVSVAINDLTAGTKFSVSASQSNLTVPGTGDSFTVQVAGFDQNGNPSSSAVVFAVQTN